MSMSPSPCHSCLDHFRRYSLHVVNETNLLIRRIKIHFKKSGNWSLKSFQFSKIDHTFSKKSSAIVVRFIFQPHSDVEYYTKRKRIKLTTLLILWFLPPILWKWTPIYLKINGGSFPQCRGQKTSQGGWGCGYLPPKGMYGGSYGTAKYEKLLLKLMKKMWKLKIIMKNCEN